MANVNAEKAAKVGDFLSRYMRARHRFKEKAEGPLPAGELAVLIGLGKQEFDEIYIEPDANPPVVLDGKASDVFDAIINKKYRAIPFFDPQLVAAWRNYVVNNGPMPRKPGPGRAAEVASIEPPIPLAVVANSPDGLEIENARCAWVNTRGRSP
jgi:hypothetical protein